MCAQQIYILDDIKMEHINVAIICISYPTKGCLLNFFLSYMDFFLNSIGQVTIAGEIIFQLNTDPATDPPVFTLTCTSTGGPATTVSWRRNGTMLSDDSNHDIMSQVTDPVTATYTNTLTVTGRLAGQYQCNVSNSRTPSGSTRSITVVGKECDEHTCLD